MLGSPITITVNGNAKAMNLINQDSYSGEYLLQESDRSWTLRVTHRKDKADKNGVVYNRHVVDFTETVYAVPGVSPETKRRVYTTFLLKDGDVASEVYLAAGLSAWLAASTNAKMTSVLGWES